jgi:hypothetical protein
MAAILRSRIHFDNDEFELAIETLDQGPKDRSLGRYLLGLLYAVRGDASTASRHFASVSVTPILTVPAGAVFQDRVSMAWSDLVDRCAGAAQGEEISTWGENGTCLPQDLPERTRAVYDIAQGRIPYYVYYRRGRPWLPLLIAPIQPIPDPVVP